MSRWRAPSQPGTALVTPEGHARLKAELDTLWRQKRPEVVRALADAAAEGDRSENAEYTYRKKQLGEIDRRVRYLGKRLETLRIVDTPPSDPAAVYFGAQVALESDADANAETRTTPERYRIVGPDETDARRGWISIDSPLARALLGRRAGDAVEVSLPDGVTRSVIVDVAYGAGDVSQAALDPL